MVTGKCLGINVLFHCGSRMSVGLVVMFCSSSFVHYPFGHCVVVLSVLQFTDSDYPLVSSNSNRIINIFDSNLQSFLNVRCNCVSRDLNEVNISKYNAINSSCVLNPTFLTDFSRICSPLYRYVEHLEHSGVTSLYLSILK